MAEVYSFRSLPPGVREEAEARGVVVRRTLTDMRTRVMPRHRPMDIDHWERTRGPEVIRLVTQAQAENAALVDRTFNLTLLAQGYMTEPIGEIRPAAFAGVMPDGDPLDLIPQAVANRVRERLATGAEPLQAWQAGGKLLATIVQTALSDSQRMAKMVAGFARPRTLYVRMLRPPSCSRCTVLAGKRGFWDKPFQRHPGCDCTQVPVPDWSKDKFEGPAFDPRAAFESLPASEQDRLFTKAGAEAIRSGADIAQVVNSRSGMSHVGDSYTRVGSTARGKAVQYFVGEDGKLRKQVNYRRLSVPKIVEMTEGNPDGRIALLYRHGYLRDVKPGLRVEQIRNNLGVSSSAKSLNSGKQSAAKNGSHGTGRGAIVAQNPAPPRIPPEIARQWGGDDDEWRRRINAEGGARKPQAHEWVSYIRLAQNGHYISIRKTSDVDGRKNPDLNLDGVVSELKAPVGESPDALRRNLRVAKRQSRSIVIDLYRSPIEEDVALQALRSGYSRYNKDIDRVLVILKNRDEVIIE